MNRTMKGTFAAALLVLGICVQGLAAQAPAGNKGTNHAGDKGKDTSAPTVSRLTEALNLVAYARENQSPLAMVAAVQMLRGVRATDSAERVPAKTTEAGTGAEGKKGKAADATIDPAALLNEAKGWAKGNAQVLAVIDAELAKPATASSGTLGASGGANRHVDQVKAYATDSYRVRFNGAELARVAVLGDGDTDLDLFIYDENGNEITRDDDRTDQCYVQWTPKWTGFFTIKIKNLGRVYNQYTVLTN
jgi:hypothetical protein